MISPAYAQAAGTGSSDLLSGMLIPMVVVFAIFYILVIRPQQRRMKEHQMRVKNVRRGDVVVTAGGIIGKVVRVVNDDEVRVEIAEGVQVVVVASTITDVRGKTQPVREKAADKAADKAAEKAEKQAEIEKAAADHDETPDQPAA